VSNRDTYNSSCKSADATQVATGLTHAISEQTTIDASKSVVGFTLQTGNMANLETATRNANALRLSNGLARERARQASIAAARDTLRATGDGAAF
jgi:hypothetical protein